jgi:NarL family two-component system sensor histidine kinase LiaS
MSRPAQLGIQWKATAIQFVTPPAAALAAWAGYILGLRSGLEEGERWGVSIVLFLLVSVAGAVLTWWITRSLKRRMWDAGDMAERIAQGDLAARIPVDRDDELGILEEKLNRMAGHLEQAARELESLNEQNRKLEGEARRGVALEERARIARDLHDTVNQMLFALSLRVAAVAKDAAQRGPGFEKLASELSALEDLARQAHAETRGIILQIRPASLEQQGLAAALAEWVKGQAWNERWELASSIDESIRLRGDAAQELFRIAQESLHNVAKHARAGLVGVTLARDGDTIILRVTDNGAGFDPHVGVRPTSTGLIGMQERMRALGGTFRVKSSPGGGTEVEARLTDPAER